MNTEYNVLVLGCGNIGAQYDFDTSDVKTHVKAWSLMPNIRLSIFDLNKELESKVATKYNCRVIESISVESLRVFDCISICTPTTTHMELLIQAFEAGVKVIICEKPITNNLESVKPILNAYQAGNSKVLVNYIRRFQPAYSKLQIYISSVLQTGETLKAINIKFNRGFINNCSHAFDLIEFIFKKDLLITDSYKFNVVYDHFDYDPTLSLSGKWGDTIISVLGLSEVLYSTFEIELYFKTRKVLILNAGDRIEFYSSTEGPVAINPLVKNEELSGCISDYMKSVIQEAANILVGKNCEDNFVSSLALNTRMLKYLNN